tara:strand:+ start:1266 stop:1472 length:207 start_codon:yes stop_codon:yes gene_type:complete
MRTETEVFEVITRAISISDRHPDEAMDKIQAARDVVSDWFMNESEKSAIMGMIDGIMGLVAEKENDLW